MYLATQDKPFFSEDVFQKLEEIRGIGFDGFEVDGKVLRDHRKEYQKASRAAGLPIRMVCGGYGGWIGDFSEEKRQQGLRDIEEILHICGEQGISGIVVPAAWGMFSLRLPPMNPPRTAREDRAVLLDSLARLDRAAGQTGTAIFLEPLNRYENHMLLRVEEAVSLIREGGFQHVRVTTDYFHMNIEEAHIEQTLARYAPYIGHVHLASSQRLEPGMGHMDYLPGLKVLREAGYGGGACIECRVESAQPMEAYEKSAALIKKLFAQAGW